MSLATKIGDRMNLDTTIDKIFQLEFNITIFKVNENLYVLNKKSFDVNIETEKYEGMILYSCDLGKTNPKRAELAKITREYNKKSHGNPVLVFFKYDGKISLALSERIEYKQDWRPGEKIGKIIILRDINITNPHPGHIKILENLKVEQSCSSYDIFKKWLEVLNIETLNDDFYEKLFTWYKLCYDDIKINLKKASEVLNKDINNELKPQAVIRVIIRLMFMWFMKEKGLINNKIFDKSMINDYLIKKDTYYNAILQNLFFAVLNKKIDERRFRKHDKNKNYDPERNDYGIHDVFRYENYFKAGMANEFLKQTSTIPYINGGLFTCHDYIFTGKDALTNEKNSINNYIIDGFSERDNYRAIISDNVIFKLIDLFNEFVFTIEESTPLEQDIALDPELLGYVFEELIAYYNVDDKQNARRDTGSFYTPRPIVDYMCAESLKAFIKSKHPMLTKEIDNLIDEKEFNLTLTQKTDIALTATKLKMLDPACGSGAFPVGMFHLLVRILEKLREGKTTFENKMDVIKECIYGVDMQNIAVEISKLRFFISLLVDYDTPKDICEYEVFPNLETKFFVADTLLDIDLQTGQNIFDGEIKIKCEELTKIFLLFTGAKTPKEKKTIKDNFYQKKDELIISIENIYRGNKLLNTSIERIKNWNPFNVCFCSSFFNSQIIFGIDKGFDIIIGNPPYIQLQNNQGALAKKYEKCNYSSLARTGDIYCLFYERGWQLLKENAFLCYITSNKWMRAGYGELTRKYFSEKTNPLLLIDFAGVKIFKSATVDTNILLFSKNKNNLKTTACVFKKENEKIKINCIEDLSNYISQNITTCSFNSKDNWVILSPIEQSIKEKIEAVGTPLKDWDIQINYGIKTGYNEAFIISGDKRKELIKQDPKSDEIIRPILRGRDIKRYGYEFADLYLICTFPAKHIDIEKYPAVKNHLLSFGKERLEQTGKEYIVNGERIKSRKKTNNKWFETQDQIGYWEDFYRQKIIYSELTQGSCFIYDETAQMFTLQTGYIIVGESLKYLLSFLNSKFIEYVFRKFYSIELGGNGLRWLKQYVENIPIPKPTKEIEQQIESLIHNKDYHAIDKLIYKIYGLNEDEISLTENNQK
jgi:hypothetical protein